jgi:MFS family permease
MPREVGVLAAVAFAVAVGFGIVAPAIPVFARDFGVGRGAAAAVISAFAFMRLVSALVGGRLVDRFGERLVLATGIGIVAVSSALAGLAQSYAQLLVLRGAGGVGSAMFSISALSLLLRIVPPQLRGRASGLWAGGFLLGGIAGPAIGGVVAAVSIRAPFFVYAATLAVAGTIGVVALRHTPLPAREDADAGGERGGLGAAVRDPAYRAALVAHFADAWAVLGVRSALIPLFVADVLRRDPVWTGIGFVVVAAVNAATLLPAGRLSDTRGRKPVVVTGCLIATLAMAVLALDDSLPGYLAAMALLGLGSGMLDVGPAAMLGDSLRGRRGTPVATYSMAGDLGTVSGPLLTGRLADTASYGAAFGVTGAVLATAAAVAAAAPETRTAVIENGRRG